MKTLADAFEKGLVDALHAESVMEKALARLAAAAVSRNLARVLEQEAKDAPGHTKMVRDIFRSIGKKAARGRVGAIDALVRETERNIALAQDEARDAWLICGLQGAEHYCISRFGTLREWAKTLGYDEAHILLTLLLDHAKATNLRLNDVAINLVNAKKA